MTAWRAALAAWAVFLVGWQLASLWAARGAIKAPLAQRLGYFAAYGLAFGLLFYSAADPRGAAESPPLWNAPALVAWVLVALEVGFFAFGVWARLHLGRLWSGMLTLREGHRLVHTCPDALVPHSIYTAFIGAGWCWALIDASPRSLAGAAILTLTMAVKSGAEETFLRRELGAAAYDAYAARTPRLIPFAPVRSKG
ncbi:isoprenylcysteine carboxylmethyltransferase family protein [soil metagenome]